MIPLKIHIKNFLSYGSTLQTIDFGTYPLIYLSGKNGHGKSALLEAITWAIWGYARKTNNISRADQGLIRLGQKQMVVMLEFDSHGHVYRIRREYNVGSAKAYTNLDFGILDSNKNSFLPLTEKTVRDTQAKIEKAISLTFESFINSSFLQQGKSNTFSQKSPKERKEILANILGLQKYELMRKRASEKMRDISQLCAMEKVLQERRLENLQKKETIHANLATTQVALRELSEEYDRITHQISIHEEQLTTLLFLQKQSELHTFYLQQMLDKKTQYETDLLTTIDQWRTVHHQSLFQENISHTLKEKEILIQQIKKHQEMLEKSIMLREIEIQKKDFIHKAREEITLSHDNMIQKEIVKRDHLIFENNSIHHKLVLLQNDYAQQQKEIISHNTALENIKITLATQFTHLPFFEKEKISFEKRKEFYYRYVTQAKTVQQELQQIKQKDIFVHEEQTASCPLCEQTLSASRRKLLKARFNYHITFYQHRLDRLSLLIQRLKAILTNQHEKIQAIEQSKKEFTIQETHRNELEKKKIASQCRLSELSEQMRVYQHAIHTSEQTINEQEQLIKQTEKNKTLALINNPKLSSLENELIEIQKSLQNISSHPSELEKNYKLLTDLEEKQKSYFIYVQKSAQQLERKKNIHILCQELKKIKQEQQEHGVHIKTITNKIENLFTIKNKNDILLAKQKEIKQKKELLLHESGRLKQEVVQLLSIEKEYHLGITNIQRLQEAIDDYSSIANAMGKDGLQALLIENIIPEIEQESNNILSKLTDNQAHISIESMRDLKNGNTKETLDINISDHMGTRPYELFSGGEAFRIDFSIRIAISKLLTRRAGTSLQTLIIDEGFGSQDEDGLNHIMEAILKIQDDFSKIIIVSHLSTMKEQFPVHFLITKGAQGSSVTVTEYA